jgi:hypothetical protein
MKGINSYPGLGNDGYTYLYTRPWFRVVPFIFGISFAIIYFEYKYVDKLSNG